MDNPLLPLSFAATSKAKTFFGGVGTGVFNSSLMLGLSAAVGAVLSVPLFPGFLVAAGMVTTIGLFSGIMSVKRSMASTDHTALAISHTMGRTSPVVGHSLQPQIEMADSAAPEQNTNWADRTGRNTGSRIQQILDNGSMSDKDRASEILAARDQANQNAR